MRSLRTILTKEDRGQRKENDSRPRKTKTSRTGRIPCTSLPPNRFLFSFTNSSFPPSSYNLNFLHAHRRPCRSKRCYRHLRSTSSSPFSFPFLSALSALSAVTTSNQPCRELAWSLIMAASSVWGSSWKRTDEVATPPSFLPFLDVARLLSLSCFSSVLDLKKPLLHVCACFPRSFGPPSLLSSSPLRSLALLHSSCIAQSVLSIVRTHGGLDDRSGSRSSDGRPSSFDRDCHEQPLDADAILVRRPCFPASTSFSLRLVWHSIG